MARVRLSGDGDDDLEVVGESHYQATLERLAGGKGEEAAQLDCVATLAPEPTNPYDDQAVRVTVEGDTVGYLSRQSARFYRAELARLGLPAAPADCDATIVGGWRDAKGEGSFGIEVDLAPPLRIEGEPVMSATPAAGTAPLFAAAPAQRAAEDRLGRRLVFVLVIGVGVVGLLAMCHAGGGRAPSSAAFDPSAYRTTCAAASVDAEHLVHVRKLEPALTDPRVIWEGPPARLQCALMRAGEVWGAVTIDVTCADPLLNNCRRVVSVTSLKRGLRYLDKTAPSLSPSS